MLFKFKMGFMFGSLIKRVGIYNLQMLQTDLAEFYKQIQSSKSRLET